MWQVPVVASKVLHTNTDSQFSDPLVTSIRHSTGSKVLRAKYIHTGERERASLWRERERLSAASALSKGKKCKDRNGDRAPAFMQLRNGRVWKR